MMYSAFKYIADYIFPTIGVAGFTLNILVLIGLRNAVISRATMILIAAQVCNNFVLLVTETVYSPLAIGGVMEPQNATGHAIPGFLVNYGIHCGEGILLAMAVQRWVALSQLREGSGTFGPLTSTVCVAASVIYGLGFGISVLFPCCVMEIGPEQGDWFFGGISGPKQAFGQFVVDWILIGSSTVIYILIGFRLVIQRKKRSYEASGAAAAANEGARRVSNANHQREQQTFRRELRLLLQFSLICCGWLLHMCIFILITVQAGNEKFDLLLASLFAKVTRCFLSIFEPSIFLLFLKFDLLLASLFAKVTRCLLSIFEPSIFLLFLKDLFHSVFAKLCPCIKVLGNVEDRNNEIRSKFFSTLTHRRQSMNAVVPS